MFVLWVIVCLGGFELNGFSFWVIGVLFVDYVVLGVVLEDGCELLFVVFIDLVGFSCLEILELFVFFVSCMGEVCCEFVFVENCYLVEGLCEDVMGWGVGVLIGGL